MDMTACERYFIECKNIDSTKAVAVCAIETLVHVMRDYKAETLAGLFDCMRNVIKRLKKCDKSGASVESACQLFLMTITFTNASLENPNIQECRDILVKRGELFISAISNARGKIGELGSSFITDGSVILTHSYSRCVLEVLRTAHRSQEKRFTVYVTESGPDKSGFRMAEDLEKMGIKSTIILDSSIGYIMEKVQLVLVGSECIVESGGVLNKIGTYTMAVCAQNANKPFYIAAESFKFLRLYPLNQMDIPDDLKYISHQVQGSNDKTESEHPNVDYTPPNLITLLFTDLGILTPSAVSDELIKIYH